MDRSQFFKKTAVKPKYDDSTANTPTVTPKTYKSKVGASQSDISNELRAINITTDRNSKNVAFKDSNSNIHAHYMKKTGNPDQDMRIENTNALIKSQTSIARSQMKFMRDQMVFNYTAQRQQHKDVIDVGSAINKNIASMITFNNTILMRHIDTTEEYYRDSIFETRKIGDLLTGISNIQMESMKNTNRQDAASPTVYEEISNNGKFDYSRYGKHVKGNLINLKDMGAFMARTAMQSNPLLATLSQFVQIKDPMKRSDSLRSTRRFGTSEAGVLTRSLIEQLAPLIGIDGLSGALSGLENTIASLPGAMLTNINNIGDNKYFNNTIHSLANSKIGKTLGLDSQETSLNGSVQFLLKSILGVSSNTDMNTGIKIDRNPMQYNTQANIAITNVIPSLLGKIYGAVSGTDGDISIDYSKGGKVIYSKNKRREVYEMFTSNASNELYDFSESMTALIDELKVTEAERSELFDDLDKTLNYIARGNNLDFRAEGFKDRFKDKSGVQHEDAIMYLLSQVSDTVMTDLPRRQLQAVTSRTNLSRELEQNTDLNGILMSYMYNELDKSGHKNKSIQRSRSYLDKLAKDNSKLGKDYNDRVAAIDGVPKKEEAVDVNGTISRREKSTYGLMETILHTLYRGIIVYPMNDIPDDVMARFNSAHGPSIPVVQQDPSQSSDNKVLGVEESELSKLKLGHNNIPSVEEVLADVDGAMDDLNSTDKGNLGLVENLLLSPMKAAVFTINGFNSIMTRIFQGGGAEEQIDKVKEWLKDKFLNIKDNLVERFNESETGQKIKGYYETAKDWLTKKETEGGLANGAHEIYTNVKNSIMDTVVNPLKDIASDLTEEGLSFKSAFGELRDTIFGTETDKGVLGNEYFKAFKGLGLKGKDYGRIAASTGMGLLMTTFLPGSPLMWGIIGASEGLLSRSKSFSDMMFGNEEEGIEGLVDPKFKEYMPKLKRGATVGLLTTLIAGPVMGVTAGAFASYANKDNLNRLFFGNKEGKAEPGSGIGAKIADAAYEKFGKPVEMFAKKQLAKTANALDRHLIQPMKYAVKPITSMLSKTLQKAFNGILGAVGGLAKGISKVTGFLGLNKAGGALMKTILGIAGAPAKLARGGIMATGAAISGASWTMAKMSMNKEEFADWSEKRKEGYKSASQRYKDNMARIKDEEKNGKKLSERFADRKAKKQKDKNLKDASGGEKEIVKGVDSTNAILKDDIAKGIEVLDENVTAEVRKTNEILSSMEMDNLVEAIRDGYEKLTDTENNLETDQVILSEDNVDESIFELPSPTDKFVGEDVHEQQEKEVSQDNVNESIFELPSPTDKFVGEDVHEQMREEQEKEMANALNQIAINTGLTAENTNGIGDLNGEGEEGNSFLDTLFSGIGSVVSSFGEILPLLPVVAGLAGAVAKLGDILDWFGGGDDPYDKDRTDNPTVQEAVGDLVHDTVFSGGGMRWLSDKVGKAKNLWINTTDFIRNPGRSIGNWFDGKKAKFNDKWGKKIDFIKDPKKGISDWFDGKKAKFNDKVEFIKDPKKGISDWWNGTDELAEGAGKYADDLAEGAAKYTDDIVEVALDAGTPPKSGGFRNFVNKGAGKALDLLTDGIRWMVSKMPCGGKILKIVDDIAPKLASKISKVLAKASVRFTLEFLEKALVVVGVFSTASAVMDGVFNWRRLLRVDDEFASGWDSNIYAVACGIALGLNDWFIADLIPREWLCTTMVELILPFAAPEKYDEFKESQENFKEEFDNSGFLDADNYSFYKNPPVIGKTKKDILNTEAMLAIENLGILSPTDADYEERLNELISSMARLAIFAHNDYNPMTTSIISDWIEANGDMGNMVMEAISVELAAQGSSLKPTDIIDRKKVEEQQNFNMNRDYYENGKNDLNKMNPLFNGSAALEYYSPNEYYAPTTDPNYVKPTQPTNAMDPRGFNYGATTAPTQPIDVMNPNYIGGMEIDEIDNPEFAGGSESEIGYSSGSIANKFVNPLDVPMQVSSDYGYRMFDGEREWHDGVDIPAPGGSPIRAVDEGKVYVSKTGYNDGIGSHVRIKHKDGRETLYGHASKLLVKAGQTVARGEEIAEVGTTGRSTGNHLHFGVYKSGSGVPKAGTGLDPYEQYMGNMTSGNMTGSKLVNSNTSNVASSSTRKGTISQSVGQKNKAESTGKTSIFGNVVSAAKNVASTVKTWWNNTFGGQKPLPVGGFVNANSEPGGNPNGSSNNTTTTNKYQGVGGPQDINAGEGTTSGSVSGNASKIWSMPLELEKFRISSGYGKRNIFGKEEMHDGIDWASATGKSVAGEPIYAARNGVISKIQESTTGFGKHIRIDHDDDLQTLYAHASKLEDYKVGDTVMAGDKIAEVGTTGLSTGNHLHFALYDKNIGTAYQTGIDPTKYIGIMSPADSFDHAGYDVNAGLDGNSGNSGSEQGPGGTILDKIMSALTSFFNAGFSGKDWSMDMLNGGSGDSSSDTGSSDSGSSKPNVPKNVTSDMLVDYSFSPYGKKHENFLEKLQPGAIAGYLDSGVLPSITMAQAAQESGWGDKALGNNMFGIKADSRWTGKTQTFDTHEYLNGSSMPSYMKDVFRAYDSVEESVADHNKFLTENKRYAGVLSAKNYRDQAWALQNAGYATDPRYAEYLIAIIEGSNKLYKTDEAVKTSLNKNAAGGGLNVPEPTIKDIANVRSKSAIERFKDKFIKPKFEAEEEEPKDLEKKFSMPHGIGTPDQDNIDRTKEIEKEMNAAGGGLSAPKEHTPRPARRRITENPVKPTTETSPIPDYNINIIGPKTSPVNETSIPETQDSINNTLDRYYGDMADSISNTYNADAVVAKEPSMDFTKVLKYLEIIANSTSNTVDAVKGLAPVITDSMSNITVNVPQSDNMTVVRATGGNNTNVFTSEVSKMQDRSENSLRNRIKSIAKGN